MKTVTIGIPAYNEEANISYLLKDIKKQKQKGFSISSIIVYSDGSTDNTVALVKESQDKRVTVIEGTKRTGIAHGLNTISRNTSSDILVILNADILIKDVYFIHKLISPIVEKNADLTSSEITEIRSHSFFEQVIQVSMLCKKKIFATYKKGNNLYTCHGLARGFSKNLYTHIKFQQSIGEDAYSYLYTIHNSYRYVFAKQAEAYYRVPDNFSDHERQSIRFLQSKKKFIEIFGEDFIEKEYHLPLYICALSLLATFKNYPIHTLLYTGVYAGIVIESFFKKPLKETWAISRSSKILHVAK